MCDKLPGLDALGAVAGRELPRDVLAGWRPESLTASSGCDSSDCAYCQVLARLRRPGASPQPSSACWLRRKRSRTDLAGLADAATPCSSCGGGEEDGKASVPRVPSTGTLTAAAGFGVPGSSMWDHALLVEDSIEEQAWRQAWQQPQQQPQQQTQQQHPQHPQQLQQHLQQQHPQRGRSPCGSPGSHRSRRRRRSSSSSTSTRSGGSLHTSIAPSTGFLPANLPAGSFNAWECHPRWQAPAELQQVASFLPPAQCGARRAANSADIVCALEFEEHGWLLASAGVSKQLRVYSLASRLQHPESPDFLQPIRCHRMPSKLSSLAWNPDAPGAVTVADYDGVVAQLDLESGHVIAEADEHGGRRVWSVSHSLQRPHLCASASEDGTVRLWGGPAMQYCLAALRPGSGSTAGTSVPACGVHLSPFDGNLAAVASADHSAYVYDLRRADQPLLQLAGHSRAVSYVRWLGPGRLATASIDASLALWQLPGPAELAGHSGEQASASGAAAAATAAAGEAAAAAVAVPLPGGSATGLVTQPWRRLRGHRNAKNFCGLSVRPEDGLVACGSEDPAAYTYHESWASPLAAHRFASAISPGSSPGCSADHCAPHQQQQQGLFCSAVAWQPAMSRPGRAPLLATALSSGELRVLELRLPATKAAGPHSADS